MSKSQRHHLLKIQSEYLAILKRTCLSLTTDIINLNRLTMINEIYMFTSTTNVLDMYFFSIYKIIYRIGTITKSTPSVIRYKV